MLTAATSDHGSHGRGGQGHTASGIAGNRTAGYGCPPNRPEFALMDKEGKNWLIEGHGVDPDIEVDNDPAKEFAGIDQQLDKAIEVILEELKTKEYVIPGPPDYPDKK